MKPTLVSKSLFEAAQRGDTSAKFCGRSIDDLENWRDKQEVKTTIAWTSFQNWRHWIEILSIGTQKKEILFDPFPNQMEFLKRLFSFKFNVLLFGGGIRGGKRFAFWARQSYFAKCFLDPVGAIVRIRCRYWNETRFRRSVKFAGIVLFDGELDTSYNHDTQTVTFKNGSQIIFCRKLRSG